MGRTKDRVVPVYQNTVADFRRKLQQASPVQATVTFDFSPFLHAATIHTTRADVIDVTTHSSLPMYRMAVGLLEATVEISFGEELPTPLLNQIQAAFVGREPVSIRFCLGSIFGKQMVTQYNNCLILSVNVTAYSVQATPTVLHLEFKGVPF